MLSHADEIISSPLRASRASEPLGSYSSRMIVGPSPAGAWLLIALDFTLGVSSNSRDLQSCLSARWAYLLSRFHGRIDFG
jgi:hypothetical protein